MPGFVAFFLTELVGIPRFNLFPLWRSKLAAQLGFADIGAHSELFKAHDYDSAYFMANMAHILFIYVPIILTLWAAAFLKYIYVEYRT